MQLLYILEKLNKYTACHSQPFQVTVQPISRAMYLLDQSGLLIQN